MQTGVVILGAGAAGLCMAIRLKELGNDDLVVVDKADRIGGTWRDNTYPGAACDVPSHLYCYSFAPKGDWSRKFPEQPEILGYFEECVRRFGLERHLRLGTEVTGATFDDQTMRWTVAMADGSTIDTEVLVSACGQLSRPAIPDIDGLESFKGTAFHSARWDHGHDLTGERIAVIGNGASAVQFVPRIAPQAGHLTIFQRSANWIAPKPDRPYWRWEKRLYAAVPPLLAASRASIYLRFEARFVMFRQGSRLGRFFASRASSELRKIASDRLPVEALIPDYAPGCKRLLISNDWYPTLLRPDVDVELSSIERITAHGIVTADGVEHPVDTIIYGTGFQATDFLAPMQINGPDGVELHDAWASGPASHLGVTVAGFPNLFLLYGPNTNLGHNSIIFMIERQVDYVRQAIVALRQRAAGGGAPPWSLRVRPDVQTRSDEAVQRAAARTVWAGDCGSWYKDESGRITNNWPGPTLDYWRRTRRFDQSEFVWRHGRLPQPDGQDVAATTG